MNEKIDIEKMIFEFIKNRSEINETTASRHIHRRFDIPIEDAENTLENLSKEGKVKKIYDDEYQENRFTT